MDGVISCGARLTFPSTDLADSEACPSVLNVFLQPHQGDPTWVHFTGNKHAYSNSITLVSTSDVTLPVTLTFSSECAIQLIPLLDRYGTINRWFVWIPATVYAGVVVAVLLTVILLRSRLPVHFTGVCLFLFFSSFFFFLALALILLSSCFSGRARWEGCILSRTLSRFTVVFACCMHCCLCLFCTAKETTQFSLWGNSTPHFWPQLCALCVSYWIMGYVVLGSSAILQYLNTNFILTYYYAYVSVYLRRAVKETSSLPTFSNTFVYLWCAPVTLFACCTLMYYELYLLTDRNVKRDAVAVRMQDVVRLYNAQMSFPLLFFFFFSECIWGRPSSNRVCLSHTLCNASFCGSSLDRAHNLRG
ncbi:hypothetical_protein (plasmid) [Leishmania braziliensis MHOM/BR/75/M2904]|uniref:Hypothetical_protein n=1 Tax=Leishmania braziliensis MHOM/BR/75/M2904 TaxID=420245 RepID=A0A3P3Z142_LEIBR|nr:hypothetical_protein [Leishmania braziliensis MHOM/BR/75/M2904]